MTTATTALPLTLWRAMNLICRGVTGAASRPTRTFITSGQVDTLELADLQTRGLVQVTVAGEDVNLADLATSDMTGRALRTLLAGETARLRATAAGNRWVGENPYNRTLAAARRLDRGDGADVQRLRAAADVDAQTLWLLADASLLEVTTPGGAPLRTAMLSARSTARVRITRKARDILAT